MKKTIKSLITMCVAVLSLSACTKEIGFVQDITYKEGLLEFSEVEGADSYYVSITHNGVEVFSDIIEDPYIDMESLGLEGNLIINISAMIGDRIGPTTSYSFTVLSTFGEVLFEAENYLYNFGGGDPQNFRNNSLAHGGAYVGGIDDAGQGIYINYLCPIAGTYDFTAYYTMEQIPGRNDVWINGEYQTEFIFTENTGYGADGAYNAAATTTKITLNEGWNTISVMKNGDESDNYGSWVELDYFVLTGNGEKYNIDDLAKYGDIPPYYRLEAEMGTPRKRDADSRLYTSKNPPIANYGDCNFSNGFILGGIETNYDGVEWQFNSPVKARYKVTLAYASAEFDGSKLPSPSFVVTQEAVGLAMGVDFFNYDIVTMKDLPYTEDWGAITIAQQTVDIILEPDKNYIYCVLLDNVDSGYFQIDYIDIEFIEEVA